MQQCRWILTKQHQAKRTPKIIHSTGLYIETKNSYKKICFLGIHMDPIKLDKGNEGK